MFPRPKLDAALEARRLEREEATRQAKAKLSRRNPKIGFARVPSNSHLAAAGEKTESKKHVACLHDGRACVGCI